MITAITLTGDRPLAFALCQQWLFHQTVKPDQWIIVDDGKSTIIADIAWHNKIMPGVSVGIRREPKPNDPKFTMGLNLAEALKWVDGDKIIIIEDDEYYAPMYIEQVAAQLDEHEVVGIKGARYYHLPSGGYMQMSGGWHASLAETAFTSSLLPEIQSFADNGDFPLLLDVMLWRRLRTKKQHDASLFADDDKFLYCGIKGLPGRAGIGIGHRVSSYHLIDPPDRPILKKWVPQDYQVYLDILSGKLNENNHTEYFKE